MKTLNVLLVFLLMAGFVLGKQVVVDLPDVNNPNSIFYPIAVDKDRIFIADGYTILIYSLENYKLLSVFGRRGAGPQEFMGYDNGCVMMSITPDNIVIDSRSKVSFYARDGVFRKEVRTNINAGYIYRPFGENYVAYDTEKRDSKIMGVIYLYDSKFNKIKELGSFEEWMAQEKINPYTFKKPLPIAYDGKLFINNFVDGTIKVFDHNAKLLYTINYNFQKIKVTAAHKKETIAAYQRDPRVKAIFRTPQAVVQRLGFPEYFPVIKQYSIADGKIYVLTYIEKDGKHELIVLDLKGKFLERKMISLVHLGMAEPSPYTISGGKIYQLVENEEKEIWQLQVTDIK